jgi:hypothetical protein
MGGVTSLIGGGQSAAASGLSARLQFIIGKQAIRMQLGMYERDAQFRDKQWEAMQPFIEQEKKFFPYQEKGWEFTSKAQDYALQGMDTYKQLYETGPGEFENSERYQIAQANIELQRTKDTDALIKSGAAMGIGGEALALQLAKDMEPYSTAEIENQYSNFLNDHNQRLQQAGVMATGFGSASGAAAPTGGASGLNPSSGLGSAYGGNIAATMGNVASGMKSAYDDQASAYNNMLGNLNTVYNNSSQGAQQFFGNWMGGMMGGGGGGGGWGMF